jgi:hypothetical protein
VEGFQMPNVQIVISVCGGVVQDVYSSRPEVQVMLVDWDVEESDPDAPGIVEIDTDASSPARAYVADFPTNSLADLAGTNVELAIQAAKRRHLAP